jgi:DNA adenine methylase
MSFSSSPLRYPGGKSFLAPFLEQVIQANGITHGTYVEAFAGGAGAALQLLFAGSVERIILNDFDRGVYSLWKSILKKPDELIGLIKGKRVSIPEYHRQKSILFSNERHDYLSLGFATLFINRCNRSGIIKKGTGPIGGKKQIGKWKIDARFNKKELIRRIQKIVSKRDHIEIHNLDALKFLHLISSRSDIDPQNTLVYLDPPYFVQGSKLYNSFYKEKDHTDLCAYLGSTMKFKWVVSYDDCDFIKELYQSIAANKVTFDFLYSANHKRSGQGELLMHSQNCWMPQNSAIEVSLHDFLKTFIKGRIKRDFALV